MRVFLWHCVHVAEIQVFHNCTCDAMVIKLIFVYMKGLSNWNKKIDYVAIMKLNEALKNHILEQLSSLQYLGCDTYYYYYYKTHIEKSSNTM